MGISPEHWAPTVGLWDIATDRFTYRSTLNESVPPFGICVSDIRFSEGAAELKMQIADADGQPVKTSGRLLFGYRSPSEEYYCVGIAGYGRAYNITRFEPAIGWVPIAAIGNEANLKFGHWYHLKVRMRGQRMTLEVDNVRVLEAVLPAPLPQGQIGLFAWGPDDVEFEDVSVSSEREKVFVVMQFTEPYRALYKDVIQEVSKGFDLDDYHVGEVFKPGIVLQDIIQGIVDSKIIIAEITPPNPNVFYELGYAHALKKPTILLAERGKELPFDVRSYRCLFYDNSIGGKREIEEGLREALALDIG